MFVKRRSTRRGPSQIQAYVPHDQRQLEHTPIPIRSKQEEEFYINQLKARGVWPDTSFLSYNNARLLEFANKNSNNYGVSFIVNGQSQRLETFTATQWPQIDVKDVVTGKILDLTDQQKIDVCNSNGDFESRIYFADTWYFVNMTSTTNRFRYWEVERGEVQTYYADVPGNETRQLSGIDKISVTACHTSNDYNDIMVISDVDPENDPNTAILAIRAQVTFRITCKKLYLWVLGAGDL